MVRDMENPAKSAAGSKPLNIFYERMKPKNPSMKPLKTFLTFVRKTTKPRQPIPLVNKAAYRCGNVHDEHEMITFYVEVILRSMSMNVSRFRNVDTCSEFTMERMVQFECE